MRSHKAMRIAEKIEEYLPSRYTEEIIKRCADLDLTVTDYYVKDVKRFKTKNAQVLNLILEFALENEKQHKKLEKTIK